MNQQIATGLNLMPPPFADGLSVYSRQDGTPGTDTYASAPNAALVPADQDFGTALEIFKDSATNTLRYMGQTPVPPGTYLRISARIKAVAGNLPRVRVAAYAARANGQPVPGVTTTGPDLSLTTYGQVECVQAIVGLGGRPGVDMVWGPDAAYGHFGIDLIGPTGGTVRVESIEIEDITSAFFRDLLDWVDVTDFGAKGDGVTNDLGAFNAADAAADGRAILVPEGTYFVSGNLTIDAPIRFSGKLEMPASSELVLNKNFDLDGYTEAFGDDVLGFKKAFQALLNSGDHTTLDMNGRRIIVDAPIDMHAAVGNRDSYANRRVIRNGQFSAVPSSAWNDSVVTRFGQWSRGNPNRITNVTNAGAIEVGSLVSGAQGVGREIYVTAVNVAGGVVTLSKPLWGPPTNQEYEFRRFKYILDFLGFSSIQRLVITNVEFLGAGVANGILLPKSGLSLQIQDCYFTNPKDRAITSSDAGCAGLQIDRNQFLSSEQALNVAQRKSIAFNTNENDAKIRDNRAVRFKHFGILGGTGNVITGNHFFQGDGGTGIRTAGIVLTKTNCKTTITGNYIDNSWIEWGNEQDGEPEQINEFSFGSLTIGCNIFTANGVANWFRWIVIRPYGPDHFINGLSICDNAFKSINGPDIAQAEGVDDDIAALDAGRFRNIQMTGNSYHGVNKQSENPITVELSEASPQQTWSRSFADIFPFDAHARVAVAVQPQGPLRNGANQIVWGAPYADVNKGGNRDFIEVKFPEAVRGTIRLTARCDVP